MPVALSSQGFSAAQHRLSLFLQLDRIHDALYEKCREQAEREASPTAAIIDSQSVRSAEKGGPRSIRTGSTQERRSRARSVIFSSTPTGC